jgi:hypothetical protein
VSSSLHLRCGKHCGTAALPSNNSIALQLEVHYSSTVRCFMESSFSCYSAVMSCRRPLPSNGTLNITPDEPCQHHHPFNIQHQSYPASSLSKHHQTPSPSSSVPAIPAAPYHVFGTNAGQYVGVSGKEKRARRVSLVQRKM